MDVKKCLELGYLKKEKPDPKMIEKELKEASYDFQSAKKAFSDKDFKWCIIKSYYSMFHSARAVLFSNGLRERRHFAVEVVLQNLAKRGKIEEKYLGYYSAAMEWREDADYRYNYSEEIASDILENAERFLDAMKNAIKNLNRD